MEDVRRRKEREAERGEGEAVASGARVGSGRVVGEKRGKQRGAEDAEPIQAEADRCTEAKDGVDLNVELFHNDGRDDEHGKRELTQPGPAVSVPVGRGHVQ